MLLINTFVLYSPNFGLPHKGVGIFLVTGFFFFWKGGKSRINDEIPNRN
ncbi:hypothetical protein ATF84_10123 [[Clostridium] innocuum]|nr:hypothetical protein ATF84_10123 [[Clostridium] innocuum]SSA37018.1 hypothetical protein SAMN04487929_10123 [[Clostridium] innocuum]